MSTKPQPSIDDDTLNPKVASSALDLLLIELVPLAQRITERVNARERALLEEYRKSRAFNAIGSSTSTSTTSNGEVKKEGDEAANGVEGQGKSKSRGIVISGTSTASTDQDATTHPEAPITSLGFPLMAPDTRDGVFWRLDGQGYRVGQGLVERFSANKPRPTTPLDAIKFICKDLWILLYRKQIDNLKTNHRGVFVLTDQRFQPLSRMSVDRKAGSGPGGKRDKAIEEAMERAQTYLYFPCGIVRGALAGLGVEVTVEGNTAEIPIATFQIKTKGAKT